MSTPADIEAVVDRVAETVLARLHGTQGSSIGRSSCEGCVGCHHCPSRRGPKIDRMIDAGAARFGSGLGMRLRENASLARMIDHTLLKPEATRRDVEKLCAEAAEHHFASVCINPCWVELSASLLRGTDVKVCTVVGFPLGATTTYTKTAETQCALADGATEIDMVINVGALKSGLYDYVERDIRAVAESAHPKAILKVILETALLTDDEKVKGCEASVAAGADFVKTSTGFSKGGATVHDVALMRSVVGERLGVKASGGVRDQKKAHEMVEAGADRIGASASVAIVSGQAGGDGY